MSDEIVIVDGVRTPQGALGGALRDVTAQKLGEVVVRALLERTKIDKASIEDVIFGCVGQSSDAPNIARVISLMAGIPKTVPGYTVARNCASGIQSIVNGCQNILSGDADIQLIGGTESMSGQPYLSRDMRFGKRLRNTEMVDSLWEGLTDPICGKLMGWTAENLAEEFKITRSEQDLYAVQSLLEFLIKQQFSRINRNFILKRQRMGRIFYFLNVTPACLVPGRAFNERSSSKSFRKNGLFFRIPARSVSLFDPIF